MKGRQTASRVLTGLAWIAGILFPFYSLRRFSADYGATFDWMFHTHASHVLMHAFLYTVMAWLLASFVPCRLWKRQALAIASVLAGILTIAISQEVIQMTCERVSLGTDEVFDIVVDLTGGLLGTMMYCKARWHCR